MNILLKSFNSKKSVDTDRMHAIVVSLTGAQAAMVTVAESDERKFQYHAKVYVDEIRASAQIFPKLTGSAITTAFKDPEGNTEFLINRLSTLLNT